MKPSRKDEIGAKCSTVSRTERLNQCCFVPQTSTFVRPSVRMNPSATSRPRSGVLYQPFEIMKLKEQFLWYYHRFYVQFESGLRKSYKDRNSRFGGAQTNQNIERTER